MQKHMVISSSRGPNAISPSYQRVLRPRRRHPSWSSPWHRKSTKKGMQKRIAQKVPLWAPCWRLRPPKNDSKMEPKMEPRPQQSMLTKHAQASTGRMAPPPLGSSVFAPFNDTGKRAPKSLHNLSEFEILRPNYPKNAS